MCELIKIKAGFLISVFVCCASAAAQAAIVDGQISSTSEYLWNTTASPNDKWYTRNGNQEFNDGSGGDNWDINYLGVDVYGGELQIGAIGGSILSGENSYNGELLELGDIAINVVQAGETVTDPAANSSGWDYALRLTGSANGSALFDLYTLGDSGYWMGSGKAADSPTFLHENYAYGSTQTFEMRDGDLLASGISGIYTAPGSGDDGVLEVSVDLRLLSLFDEATGGRIITYLTMSCANDEAIVEAHVSPVPIPSTVWLFGSALLGFIGLSRSTRV